MPNSFMSKRAYFSADDANYSPKNESNAAEILPMITLPRTLLTRWLIAAALILGSCVINATLPPDEAPPPPPLPAVASPPVAVRLENTPEVVDILEKHITAIGGREALKAIRTIDTQRETEVLKSVQRIHEIRDKRTGRFYSKTEGPNGTVEIGFDGKRVWQRSPFFKGYLPETEAGAKNLSRHHPELYEYDETGQKFARLPNEAVNGKPMLVLFTRSNEFDPQGRETDVKYYFDPETFLLRRMVIGSQLKQTIDFDDYREVEGTWLPFSSTATNPNITVRSTVKGIRYNAEVDPRVFEYDGQGTSAPTQPGSR